MCVCFSTQAHTRRVFLEAIPIFIQIWSFFSSFELYNKNAVHKLNFLAVLFALVRHIIIFSSSSLPYFRIFVLVLTKRSGEYIYNEPEFYLVIILLKITQKWICIALLTKKKKYIEKKKLFRIEHLKKKVISVISFQLKKTLLLDYYYMLKM